MIQILADQIWGNFFLRKKGQQGWMKKVSTADPNEERQAGI